MARFLLVFLALFGSTSCFGARSVLRSYYVLHGAPESVDLDLGFDGLVRVRNLDSDAVYEKFQIVVRRNPYELRYSDLNVWAVKPNAMISDIVAQSFAATNTFRAVNRVLGDTRPDYTLSGELHAIEVYDSDDLWFAHLAVSLRLTAFDTGETVWTFSFNERKHVPTREFSHAVRAISELLIDALAFAVVELKALGRKRSGRPPRVPTKSVWAPQPEPDQPAKEEGAELPSPIFVPEPTPESE